MLHWKSMLPNYSRSEMIASALSKLYVEELTGCWVADVLICPAVRKDGVRKGINLKQYIYEYVIGPIPPEVRFRARCENRRCFNPHHLIWNRARDKKGSSTYFIWNGMRNRCQNELMASYPNYGGRGIKVCEVWDDPQTGFAQFLQDMGEKPPGLSLDRIDVNGDYTASNCAWATNEQQANNRTISRLLTVRGITLSIPQWARQCNVLEKDLEAYATPRWGTQDVSTMIDALLPKA